ncbi:MAG: hypothetical protein JXA28_09045 [Bacteroidetes bacterium]|nr:hypothetical protein [Bacteroidota bacterium]
MISYELISALRYCRRVLLGLAKKHGFEIIPTLNAFTYGNRPDLFLVNEDRNALFMGDTVLPDDEGRPAPSAIALLRSYVQRFLTLQQQEQYADAVFVFVSESPETIRSWSDMLDSLTSAMDLFRTDGERIIFEVQYLNDDVWLTWGTTNPDFRLLT